MGEEGARAAALGLQFPGAPWEHGELREGRLRLPHFLEQTCLGPVTEATVLRT